MKEIILIALSLIGILNSQIFKRSILDTNKVSTTFDNRGGIGNVYLTPQGLVWPKGSLSLPYIYQMGLIIGGEVINTQGDTLYIVSDGFLMIDWGDYEPGTVNPWGWLPIPGYDNPVNNHVAISDDTTTWSPVWQAWPGKYGTGILRADLETFWVMNDSSNAEFSYYPLISDSCFRGLGLEVSCRGYQWNIPEFEDFIIFTYDIKNVSDYELDKLSVGFFCDPIIGGPNDFTDDLCNYDFVENLVIGWDYDGIGDEGKPTGYLGFLTLESPDQLGLTSVVATLFGGNNKPRNDYLIWQFMTPGNDSIYSDPADFVVCFSSGYFSLDPGEIKIYAIACVLGLSEENLYNNVMRARNAYDILTSIHSDQKHEKESLFHLGRNYPNPFNSHTSIDYELHQNSNITIMIYDILGRPIRTLVNVKQKIGENKVIWNGLDEMGNPVSSGIYFYQISSDGFYQSKKMILIK